jgi:predicted DCC family thiol-disulfide oxidoreductase YuxK
LFEVSCLRLSPQSEILINNQQSQSAATINNKPETTNILQAGFRLLFDSILSLISENMENTDKILIYDDDCPLCVAYTSAFVHSGLLTREGRQSFTAASPELLHIINWQRSINEIPLLDPTTKQVWYGIDALLEILGQKCALIKTIGRFKPVNWFLKKLYSFISYNRKVIVAARTSPLKIDCTPAFNLFYRVLFMIVFLAANTLMIYPVHQYLLSHIPGYTLSTNQLLGLHGIMVILNCLLALFLPKQTAIEYLGQVNMLTLVTNLLLIPLIVTNAYLQPGQWVNYSYLVLLTIFVFKEYFRRMDYANILYNYWLIVLINHVCVIGLFICLFVPLSK